MLEVDFVTKCAKLRLMEESEIARIYVEEQLSVLALSKRANVSRTKIVRIIRDYGLSRRTGTESNLLRFAKSTVEEREALTKAAHNAVRGTKRDHRVLCDRSRVIQKIRKSTKIESIFLNEIRNYFPSATPEYSVDKFNIDIAIIENKIAFEIDPGYWHTTQKHAESDRVKDTYLIENGWRVFRISGHNVRTTNPNLEQYAKNIINRLVNSL